MSKHYRLLKGLASGGMAHVWIGVQKSETGFSKVCAIKTLKEVGSHDQDFFTMFRDEAKICQSLQHANIVQVLDFTVLPEGHALVMEFVDGINLFQLMLKLRELKKALPLPAAVYIAHEVAKGLHYVHSRKDPLTDQSLGIIHRDISPSNILISSEGEVKITDFGIAKAKVNAHATQVGVVKGKFQYMSPEQFKGHPVGPSTDIYALGCVIWECLAGRKLYEATSDAHLVQLVVDSTKAPDITSINPDVDEDFAHILNKTMERDVNRRYRSAESLATEIYQYMAATSIRFGGFELAGLLKSVVPIELDHSRQLLRDAIEIGKQQTGLHDTASNNAAKEASAKEFGGRGATVSSAHDEIESDSYNKTNNSKDKTQKSKDDVQDEDSGPTQSRTGTTLFLPEDTKSPFQNQPTGFGKPTAPQPAELRNDQALSWQRSIHDHTGARLRRRPSTAQSIGNFVANGIGVMLIVAALSLAGIFVAQYYYGYDVIGEVKKLSAKIK